jgi:endonuclease/exonuclease/phosphatase family metal-dependent hydrolase
MAATVAPIRLLTYNIHRWGDDRRAVAEVITRCAPDVAMIQEAPTWWWTRRRRLALARTVGLHYLAGAARTIALVADPLRWTARRARIRRPLVRRRKRLVALQLPGGAVAVSCSDPALTVIGCHLGLATGARSAELHQVFDLGRPDEPTVIAGDVNERPGGPVWQLAARLGLSDVTADAGPTFPSGGPQARIDAVWASTGLQVNRIDPEELGVTRRLLVRASDHLPLLVEIRRS